MPTLTSDYRYHRFTPKLLLEDLRFGAHGLTPGDELAPIELPTTAGDQLTVGGPRSKPMLLITGSLTCPMTDSAMPSLIRLHAEFGEAVDFVLVSVRQAHPGELLPQSDDADTVREQASALAAHFDVPFTVAIDTVDGRLHHLLDKKPNTAFLIGVDGRVAFRSHWARDEAGLRPALAALAQGDPPPKTKSSAMIGPVMRAMGSLSSTMQRGGRQAGRDLWRSAPPMAMMGAVARLMPFDHADHRGIAGAALLMISMLVGLAVLIALVL